MLGLGVVLASIVTSLTACQPGPTKVVTKEVPVEVYVALEPRLTADVKPPVRPPYRCADAQGRATICNEALASWLLEYDAALKAARGQLREIRNLQPKETP
jgi:hypothetical protein